MKKIQGFDMHFFYKFHFIPLTYLKEIRLSKMNLSIMNRGAKLEIGVDELPSNEKLMKKVQEE